MAGLAKDSAAFKSVLQRQDYSSWHSNPAAAEPATETTRPVASSSKKKSRPKSNVVYSQPADTGTGNNVNTQLVYAVNHLQSTPNPMRLQDIAIVTNTPLDTDRVLLEKFKAHDRIQWDPKTDLYSYKHEYTFRTKAALLTEIQRQTRKGGGIAVRALKESWKEAPAAIEELEKEGEVLVTRTQKDGTLRMVFWNELKGEEKVEEEFLKLWHGLKTPNDVDLLKSLSNDGLQLTQSSTPVPKATTATGKKKGKRAAPRQRQARITNTHLKGGLDLGAGMGRGTTAGK